MVADTQFKPSGMIVNRSMPPGTIIPELVYGDMDSAVTWLCQTFGFRERLRIANHRAQLVLGAASLVVVAQSAGHTLQPRRGEVTHSLMWCASPMWIAITNMSKVAARTSSAHPRPTLSANVSTASKTSAVTAGRLANR